MKIALVYDRVNKIGGAEKVLQALHEIWPSAPVYAAVYNPATAPWAKDWDIRPSWLQSAPFARRHHEWYFWAANSAFESFDFSSYDVVISVTSAEAKSVITPPRTLHLCYLLTPTKYLWSHTHLYRQTSPFSRIGKIILTPLLSKARITDQITAQRPDKVVAISQAVADRVKKYYRRQTDAIIYPPVNVKAFASPPRFKPPMSNYYLAVSRLVPAKRIDVLVDAFNQTPQKKLVVVGTGVDEKRLQTRANSNILFTGAVSDQQLSGYYHHGRALLFPQEEDFGIVAVEAQAAGTPILAYHKGGALETIIPGKTGEFFTDYSQRSIMGALDKIDKKKYDKKIITTHAQKFATKNFTYQITQFVEAQWEKHQTYES